MSRADESPAAATAAARPPTAATLGLIAGPVAAAMILWLVPVAAAGEAADAATATATATATLSPMGRVVLALMVWMAVWWMTEAIPLAATALLPLFVLPVAAGFAGGPAPPADRIAAAYANPYIFLFGGGFLLALAMERWGLHRRIALLVLARIGGGPRTVVAVFMLLAAVFSMWVSNTATAVMMLPIALSIISRASRGDAAADASFARALLLGIAWGCSIGGVGTLIGTPPNALLASFIAQEYGDGAAIGFAQWMMVGIPVVAVMLPLAWLVLTRVVERVPATASGTGREAMRGELAGLGPVTRPEAVVLLVFITAALSWMSRPLWTGDGSPLAAVTDPMIAIAAAVVLFAVPSGHPRHARVLDWDAAMQLPWGILLLFGGGLALAGAITETGVDRWIGAGAHRLGGLPAPVMVLVVVTAIVFLTEFTSNTATTAAALPVLAAVAVAVGIEPLLLLVPAAIAASCAFMMPVATPPNAIVFGSGRIGIAEMVRAGLVMNAVSVVVVTLAGWLLVGLLLAR